VVADTHKQRSIYHDSLKNNYEVEIHYDILSYLELEHRQKLGQPLHTQDWTILRGNRLYFRRVFIVR